MSDPDRDDGFEELLEYLRTARGFDFTGYKRSTLARRVTKRMQLVGVPDVAAYVDYLQVHQHEIGDLFNFILINVTSFFRDPPVWDYLAGEIVPELVERRAPGAPIRIWSAGCASGEEAYSIAMLFAERMDEAEYRDGVRIYATDADEEAIAAARQGLYSAKAVEPIDPGRLERFFEPAAGGFAFRRDLRGSIIFGRHDLVRDAPIGRTDLVSCRNTLMYLNAATQAQVMGHLRFSLNDRGVLVLGKSEMLFTPIEAFVPLDLKRRVFVKQGAGDERGVMAPWGSESSPGRPDVTGRLRTSAFEEAPVAQFLVGEDRRLVMANRRARDMFGLRDSDVGRTLWDLELSYRPAELRGPIEEVGRSGLPIDVKGVPFHPPGGTPATLNIEIAPLDDTEGPTGVSVSFVDVSEAQQLQHALEGSNQELETAMEELQSSNEELETTNEELQSTNEELETTNEELQSTNEELETMNEELQSTNEELSSVNLELGDRSRELTTLNTFMNSILASMHTGVVVLDADLRIGVWNSKSEDLWGLRADEVRGRPLLNLDVGLALEPVRELVHRAMSDDDDDGDLRTILVDATNRRGRPIRCRVTASRFDDGTSAAGLILLVEEEMSS